MNVDDKAANDEACRRKPPTYAAMDDAMEYMRRKKSLRPKGTLEEAIAEDAAMRGYRGGIRDMYADQYRKNVQALERRKELRA